MTDRFTDPLMTPRDTARHLMIPQATLYDWLRERANGAPLVHQVAPEKRGWPSVPFVAVVEAYVLRSLRDLKLSKKKIRAAAGKVRREFDTPYALATRRIATDGVDVFVEYAEGDLARAEDDQRPIREFIQGYLRYIRWDADDEFASQLRLRQYPDIAPVVIDPRFGHGSPVLESSRVPVDAVVDLWISGEPLKAVAYEYDMTEEQVEAICRTYPHRAVC